MFAMKVPEIEKSIPRRRDYSLLWGILFSRFGAKEKFVPLRSVIGRRSKFQDLSRFLYHAFNGLKAFLASEAVKPT